MKKCPTCGITKPLEDFGANKARHDGKQFRCKSCRKIEAQERYTQNKPYYKEKAAESKKRGSERNRQLIKEYKESHPCVDCGISDWRVLEFDHLSDKEYDISRMASHAYRWESVLAEIAKCDVVCANCHRIRTMERGNWWHMAVGQVTTRLS